MFILSSISSGAQFWSVNHTSIYENSELMVFKNIKILGEKSNNCKQNLTKSFIRKKCIQDLEFYW